MSTEIPYAFPYAYTSEVASRIKQDRIWDTDYALSQDPEFYAKIEKDAIIAFLIEFRCQLVAGFVWGCDPVTNSETDKRAAEVMETVLGQIAHFSEARRLLARAFLRGTTWARIGGELRDVSVRCETMSTRGCSGSVRDDGFVSAMKRRLAADPEDEVARYILRQISQPGTEKVYKKVRAWCPTQLRDVDKRQMINLRHGEGENQRWAWHFSAAKGTSPETWPPIDTRHWVHHVYRRTEASMGQGDGLAKSLYFLSLFKAEAMARGMSFLERWAEGFLVAKIDPTVIAALGETADARATTMKNMLKAFRSQHAAVIGQGDEVDLLEGSSQGWETVQAAIDYCDNAASRLILGAVLPTGGATDKGSLARAAVESDSTAALIAADREMLAEAITQSVLKLAWDINRPLLVSLGLGAANMPRMVIRNSESHDPKERAEIAVSLIGAGLGGWLDPKDIISQSGFKVAAEGAETVSRTPVTEAAAPQGEQE